MNVTQDQLEALAQAARQAAGLGLMQCSSGNLSCRLDDKHLLIKGSGSWMSELSAEDVAVCTLEEGRSVNGVKPSVEIGFHRGVMQARDDVKVVLHFQSPMATTLCCREPRVTDFAATPEVPYYIGPVAWVPYILPGSVQLAEAVTLALRTHNLAMLANHGQVTVGKNYTEAIQRAVFFESACDIIVRNGSHHRGLSEASVSELRDLADGKGFGV